MLNYDDKFNDTWENNDMEYDPHELYEEENSDMEYNDYY